MAGVGMDPWIERRVAALTPEQKGALRRRLSPPEAEDDAARGRRLVAFVVPSPGSRPEPGELRRFLSAALPSYMMPSSVESLPALPLTPNGKVDRHALARQAAVPGEDAPPLPAPSASLEERLGALWNAALGVDHVGHDDSFFDLGGDSIVCLKLCAAARRVGVALTPRLLYEHPAFGDLLAALAGERAAASQVDSERGA